MGDESLYNMGKEVGALQQQVEDLAEGVKAIREEAAGQGRQLTLELSEHNHGDLEHALESAGLIEWVEEDSCWRVVPAVVAIVRPDKVVED